MNPSTCLVVMYHYVRDSASTTFPAIRALPPEAFEQQLDWLQREYQVIRFEELDAAVAGSAALPPRAALLTFDDGFTDHYATVWPILRARGLSGIFFLTQDACSPTPRVLGVHKTHFLMARLGADAFAQAVLDEGQRARGPRRPEEARVFGADRWDHPDERAIKELLNYELPFAEAEQLLDALFARHVGEQGGFARELYLRPAMIEEMARGGMTFGYHTRSHRMLSRLSIEEQESELRDGVAWIQELTGQPRVPFCYPWGGPQTYTGDTPGVLARAGYALAFNTVRRTLDVARDRRYELPRLDTRDLPPHVPADAALAAAGCGEEA